MARKNKGTSANRISKFKTQPGRTTNNKARNIARQKKFDEKKAAKKLARASK